MTPPKIPTRTDAHVECSCGGTMSITTVAPVPGEPTVMSHSYQCRDCGTTADFKVAKKGM